MFKVGDKVVCVDSDDTEDMIKKGETYAVSALSSSMQYVELNGKLGQFWRIDRFKLYTVEITQPTTTTNASDKKQLGSNPKDLIGIKKLQMNLVPPASKAYQALAMDDGAKKYGPYNWRENKVVASIYYAALNRHMDSWWDGENDSLDSKIPHLAHAIACIGIIIDALETGNLVDDRPAPGAMSKLIERYKKS